MVALDVAAAEVVDVGVPEAGEAAEEKDVPDRIQVGLGFGEFQVTDAGDFLLSEVNDLPLRHLQGRMELLIVKVGVVSTVVRPCTAKSGDAPAFHHADPGPAGTGRFAPDRREVPAVSGPISSRSGNKGWCDNRQGTSSFVICGEIWAFTLVLSARPTDYQCFNGNSEGK